MGKHAPLRLDKYLSIHNKAIRDLTSRGFLLDDDLEITAQGDDFLTMSGVVYCASEIRIQVLKLIRLTGEEPLAQAEAYTYNAVLAGVGNILRYNSPHANHNPFHHVHRYNVLSGDKDGVVEELSEEARPTLSQVVLELEQWCWGSYDEIQRVLGEA